ncbi:FAD-dependent oxidoreductase [Oceaniferula flava]|nr:NAD(P)/FAD-dependent oxidoreductase [Oceaniferula flavus]
MKSADVVIIGAGMAGCISAKLLAAQGLQVILVDRFKQSPPVFRAEKLEKDQIDLLAKFDLLSQRRPLADPLGVNVNYNDGRITEHHDVEQYGIRYHDTINQLRQEVSKLVEYRVAKVESIVEDPEHPQSQIIHLADAEPLHAPLVIVASGYRSGLLKKRGVQYREDKDLASISYGFDIERPDQSPFDSNAYGYFLKPDKNGIDYITIFRIGETMRANVFTQLKSSDPRVKELKNNTYPALQKYFPDLEKLTDPFQLISKVEMFATYFYQMRTPELNGVVAIGDAYQSVSPTTGTGLSKVLNDVDVLCNVFVPRWFQNQSFDHKEINEFYQFAQKKEADTHSSRSWKWYADPSSRSGLVYRLKQNKGVQWLVQKLKLRKLRH